MAGKLFVISAPSGTGKTSLLEVLTPLLSLYNIKRAVTYTSRRPRQHEQDGDDYHFLSSDEFNDRLQTGFFVEWSSQCDHYYGSARHIIDQLNKGSSFIMILDRAGAQNIKKIVDGAVLIWMYVSSLELLHSRLIRRQSETQEHINLRMQLAAQDMSQEIMSPIYHHHILHENFEQTLKKLFEIVKSRLY